MKSKLRARSAMITAFAGSAFVCLSHAAFADPVVFAAASLKNALDDAAALYNESTGKSVTLNYAGSATLAKQIIQGAPADIFFSANLDWMEYLDERGLIDGESRVTLLGNSIVLIAPKESDASIEAAPGTAIIELLGANDRLAMANVESVPAGLYGKAALASLGVWEDVADRVVQTDNVRAALAFVAAGEAPVGIVYATDAAAEPAVKVLATFPGGSHPPIRYPVALTAGPHDPDAAAFLDYLTSEAARRAFEKQGFVFMMPESRV